MIILYAIDAWEGQCIVMTNILGTLLHADMEQDLHMLLEGTIAEIIMKLEPSLYQKFITNKAKPCCT